RSDVWSLGVTAYEALTGRLPFAAGSYGELYRLVSEGRRAPATQLNAALPATIERWFDGMLAPDPSRRFQSVMDAASALDLALAGRGSEAMHATVAAPDVEPVRAPPAASTSLSRPLLAPPSPSVAPTVGPTPFPGAPHAQAPRPLSGGALLVGGAGLVALSVALSAWLLRSDEPEPVVSAPPRVPLQPLRLDPPSVLARPLAEKLLKAAGGEARRALSFQVSTGAATLRTWSGGAVVRRIATLQTLEERPDNLDRDDPVFDFAAIDLDQAGRVIQQAGGDHPENVELIVLKGCSGYDCGSHLKEGTPVWCVFLKGDSRRWYDLRGQLVFETKR
ncbi:MAG: hypothetical protein KC731_16985, partial [Myxococcales bacterium]|nr:hypothetical protein [Myxococcales bacterium]